MDGSVTLTVADHVADLVLDRPAKHNAMTPAMSRELARLCAQVESDPEIRVAILRGAGERAFCAGSDLAALAEYKSAWEFRARVEYSTVVRDLTKPVIAVLRGWVLGGGLELSLAADIRLAGRSAKLGAPEVKRGWIGGGGASQLLPRLIGYGQAMRLLLTGETIDAEEALRLGLIEELHDDAAVLDRARAMATQIAGYAPQAVQSVKAATRLALSAPLDVGLRYENEMNTLCFTGQDHLEGIKAFYEKRQPRFTGSD
jgi:enoyl-CoA hydratase/carnithine racemase